MQAIYKPKGRAGEYCSYAVNVYTGYNHGCDYCYARKMANRWGRDFTDVSPRAGILEAVKRQMGSGEYAGKLVNLCFSCDPYPAPPVDTQITREVIKAIKDGGGFVQILTKGSSRAMRDFDLLGPGDWFGVSIGSWEGTAKAREPYADPPSERAYSLFLAQERHINTWVSCEPVIDPQAIFELIKHFPFVDLYNIGKMNYAPSDIDWPWFGAECERLCKAYHKRYYIKEDLKKAMEGHTNEKR